MNAIDVTKELVLH